MSWNNITWGIIAVGILIGVSWLNWEAYKMEKMAHWKYSYGPRVEKRFREIEERLNKLETNAIPSGTKRR